MASINGDLALMPVEEVVGLLQRRGSGGVLRLSHGGVERRFHVAAGSLIQAHSDESSERLGQHLLSHGYLTERQLDIGLKGLASQGPLGVLLRRQGLVDDQKLWQVLAFKAREVLLAAFEWGAGTFEFSTDTTRRAELDFAEGLSLAEIQSEAEARRVIWDDVRSAIGTDAAQLAPAGEPPADLNLFDFRLVELAAAGNPVSTICSSVRSPRFYVMVRLRELVRRGVLRAAAQSLKGGATGRAGAADDPANEESLVTTLRQAMRDNDITRSYAVARKILARFPDNGEALAACSIAEAMAFRMETRPTVNAEVLKHVRMPSAATGGPPPVDTRAVLPTKVIQTKDVAVPLEPLSDDAGAADWEEVDTIATPRAPAPRLLVDKAKLERMALGPRERKVLLLVDGKRSVTEIQRLAGIKEEEVAKVLATAEKLRLVQG